MILVDSEQDLVDLLVGLRGFFSQAEAVAATPRLVVKRCTLQAKSLDRTITQDNEIGCAMCGLPACSSLPATQRVVRWFFHAPSFPTVSEQGRLSK